MRKLPLYEVLGQIGMWGTLIIGIQAAGLEYKGIKDAPWNAPIGEFRSIPLCVSELNTCSKLVCC